MSCPIEKQNKQKESICRWKRDTPKGQELTISELGLSLEKLGDQSPELCTLEGVRLLLTVVL